MPEPDQSQTDTATDSQNESSFTLHLSDSEEDSFMGVPSSGKKSSSSSKKEDSFMGVPGSSKKKSPASKKAKRPTSSETPMDVDDSYEIQLAWEKCR